MAAADWRASGLRYYALGHYLRRTFGARTWKVSVDAQFACPNTDGTVGAGGCVFCNIASFSPSRRGPIRSITQQLAEGTRRIRQRYGVDRFVAYFQPGTNTYAPLSRLQALYEEAASFPGVVGLAVGTRPDCVPNPVLELLANLARRTWIRVEYGLQTIHDRSLAWMNRGHDYQAFVDAVQRSRQFGLLVGAHVILGIPGESRDDMLATARELARLRIHAVKLHNLCAVKGTPLADAVARGEVRLLDREEYVGYVVDFLELLPPDCVVDRLGAEAPVEYLLGPAWCLRKAELRAAVDAEMQRRNTWQSRRFVLDA